MCCCCDCVWSLCYHICSIIISLTNIMDKLASKIPDFKELVDIFNGMIAQHNEDTAHIEDTQKTSLLLLLGVLYRYQKRTRSRELDLASSDLDIDSDVSATLGATCARYWDTCHDTGVTIRRHVASATGDTLPHVCADNRLELAKQLNIEPEDVILTWVSELQSLEEINGEGAAEGPSIDNHCPDFTITVDREQRCVVVTLLGTRVFPHPNIYDVVMDLRVETSQVMDGRAMAHAGMAIGAQNIMDRSFSSLRDSLQTNPDYSILVVGYSLGAGMAQLYTAMLLTNDDLRSQLPDGVRIRALCYGAPPVFRWNDDECGDCFKEIFIIQHDKDGIISASSASVVDLFNKTVAIDAADLEQDVMLKMLLEKIDIGAGEAGDEDTEVWSVQEQEQKPRPDRIWSWQDLKTTISRSFDHYRSSIEVDPVMWDKVDMAVTQRKLTDKQPLSLMGQTVLQMKNVDGRVRVRKFEGMTQTCALSRELRLSKKMFDHHMPWGYSHLFNLDKTDTSPDLSVFDNV